jgi:hypothetical protein
MIYILSFIKTGSHTKKLRGVDRHTDSKVIS